MGRYASGRRFEYKVRDYFLSQECFVVRSAGSKGPVDLVVFWPGGKVWMVQCKNNRSIPTHERSVLKIVAKKYKHIPIFVIPGKKDAKEKLEVCYI